MGINIFNIKGSARVASQLSLFVDVLKLRFDFLGNFLSCLEQTREDTSNFSLGFRPCLIVVRARLLRKSRFLVSYAFVPHFGALTVGGLTQVHFFDASGFF